MTKKKPVNGFTLIEVLVALLVLGVGVLGFAGLQLQALKVTGEAYARDQASNLAVDLVERIRINRDTTAAVQAEYLRSDRWGAVDCDIPPVPYCATNDGLGAAECSTLQMAVFDVFDVKCTAQNLIPNGRVFIASNCGGGSNPCIRVAWDNHGAWDGENGPLELCRQNSNCVELEIVQ